MNTNADITIINKWYNPATRLDEWRKTQIQGVNWHGSQAVAAGDNGLVSANRYVIRVPIDAAPADKTWIHPEEFAAKAKDVLDEFWTLRNGDYIVRGLVDADISSPKEIPGEHFVVTGWSDNRRGSPATQHWRVDGQ